MNSKETELERKIIESFYKLSFEHGLKKVTIDMLARDCGIAKKTIYTVYKDKDEIIDRFAHFLLGMLDQQFYFIQIKENDPAVVLNRYFDVVIEVTGKIPGAVFEDVRRFYPHLEDIITTYRKKFSVMFLKVIKNGIESGAFHPIDLRIIEGFYLGAINYMFNSGFLIDNNLSVDETLHAFKTILLSALVRNQDK